MRNSGNTEKDFRWYFNDSKKGEINLFGKVNFSITDKTTVFGDLQYRHIIYKMAGIDDDITDIGQEHSFGFFNPKAGIFYSISPDQDAYFSFSVANREPTRADFKEASGDQKATPLPETLYDSELGYKLRRDKYSFAVNLYGMFYKDQLVSTGELSNVGYSIMTNVGKSYRTGIELMSGIKFSDILNWDLNMTLSSNKITDFVEYYTDYNTSDWSSQYLSKNLGKVDIAYSPSFISISDIGLNLPKGFELHLISKYVGMQYFDNTMSSDRRIDSYFINNLRIDMKPKLRNLRELQFQFLINNLFNEIYESNAYGGNWYEDGEEKTWSYFFPQAGINYMLRVSCKF
jgi:iron complex outermembrane receptor protein